MSDRFEISKADAILLEAKTAIEYGDTSNVKLFYDLYDEINDLKLTTEEKNFYKTRLDVIFGQYLK